MKVANDQTEYHRDNRDRSVRSLDRIVWAIDIVGAPSAMLLALLIQAGQSVRYASGRVVAAMSSAYSGEGKTDAKDAYVIAETARIRRDLTVIDPSTNLVRNLELLTAHRADLIADRVRMINRLRDVMTSVFPSLEREFDYSSCKGALDLLTGYASPERLRHVAGDTPGRLAAGTAGTQTTPTLAARAVTAARAQQIVLPRPGHRRQHHRRARHQRPGPRSARERPRRPDRSYLRSNIPRPKSSSPCPDSAPSWAPHCWSQPVTCAAFPSAGHLAAAAGLVPVPNDSGRRTGNLHKPRRYSRPLRHVFYLSAQTSMMRDGPNRDYYLKKRAPRPHPHPGRHRPGPPPHRRPLGTAARRTHLHLDPTRHSLQGGLTTPLRFPMPTCTRSVTSAGRSAIIVMLVSRPRAPDPDSAVAPPSPPLAGRVRSIRGS